MEYRVELTPIAEADLEAVHSWIAAQSSKLVANDWFYGIQDATLSLSKIPERCPRAPESRVHGVEIRELVYGNRRVSYRVLFQLLKGDGVVRVLRVIHSARRFLRLDELSLN